MGYDFGADGTPLNVGVRAMPHRASSGHGTPSIGLMGGDALALPGLLAIGAAAAANSGAPMPGALNHGVNPVSGTWATAVQGTLATGSLLDGLAPGTLPNSGDAARPMPPPPATPDYWQSAISGAWGGTYYWSTGAVPNSTSAVFINLAGTYGVSVYNQLYSAYSVTISASGADLDITSGGTLATGATVSVSAGTLQLDAGGELLGGTLSFSGGGILLATGGTLSGVTCQGVLAQTSGTLTLVGSESFVGSGGAGIGTINLTGNDSVLTLADGSQVGSVILNESGSSATVIVDDSHTLNGGTLNVGSNGTFNEVNVNDDTGNGATLTFGGSEVVNLSTGDGEFYLESASDALINQGAINVSSQAQPFSILGAYTREYFLNEGIISVSNGGTLLIDVATTNAGSINVSGTNSLLGVGGTFTSASLASLFASINNSGGTLALTGLLNNSGTLQVGTGTAFGTLFLDGGTLSGGTISDVGGGLTLLGGSTFSGISYQGALSVQGNLFLYGTDSFAGASGSGTGTINVSGAMITYGTLAGSSTINLVGNEAALEVEIGAQFGADTINLTGSYSVLVVSTSLLSLDNGVLNIGNAAAASEIYFNGGHSTLVLGAQETLNELGLATVFLESSTNSMVNVGKIEVAGAGSVLNFFGGIGSFSNQGSVIVTNAATLDLSGLGTFSSLNGSYLLGGSYEVDAGSTLRLLNNSSIVYDEATIILGGAGSVIESENTSSGQFVTIDQTLLNITNFGILELLGGRNFTASAGYFTDGGLLQLGGGTFAASSGLSVAATGTLTGFGTLTGAVADAGSIAASGGTLVVTGALSGAGQMSVASGAVLDLRGGDSLTQTLSGAGTLQLDSGTYTLAGGTLSVQAVVVDAGATLSGYGTVTGTVSDAGTVVANGGILLLSGAVSGTGGLAAASGAVLDLSGGEALNEAISGAGTLQLDSGNYSANGGSVAVATLAVDAGATLTETGTLAIGAGQAVATLDVLGTISGGTISDAGGGLQFGGGTLSAVTTGGTMTVQSATGNFIGVNVDGIVNVSNAATLNLRGGLNATSGGGTINLSGSNAVLNLYDTQTLNNATLNFGGATSYNQINLVVDNGGPATLTLGSNFALNATGKYTQIQLDPHGANAATTLANLGTITAGVNGGNIEVTGGTFLNHGSLVIDNGDAISVLSTFTNTGSITLNNGNLDLYATVTSGGLGFFRTYNGSAIGIEGNLQNAGQAISLGAAAQISLGGTIIGGEVIDSGGGLTVEDGTLSGVDYVGTLNLSQLNTYLSIDSGLNAGIAPSAGTINLSGETSLYFDNTETVGDATIQFGNNSDYNYLVLGNAYGSDNGSQTLTISSEANLTQTGRFAEILLDQAGSGNALINQGTITAAASGGILEIFGTFAGDEFTNQGSLIIGNGEQVDLVTNVGALGNFSTAGGGTLVLGYGYALANAGGTLNLGSAAQLTLNGGTIDGGTVADSGDGLLFGSDGGTFSAVTYDGVLNLTGSDAALFVSNGLNASGGNARFDVTGNGASMNFLGSQTLGYGTVELGSTSGTAYLDLYGINGEAATLTLGAGTNINQYYDAQEDATYAQINYDPDAVGGNSLVNDGGIAAGIEGGLTAGGTLSIVGDGADDSFTNNGALYARNGGTLDLSGAGSLTNLSNGTLSGNGYSGFIYLDQYSTIILTNDADITTLSAYLDLAGYGATVEWLNTQTNAENTLQQTLATISSSGSLQIINQNYTAGAAFSDDGTLSLVATSFGDASGLAIGPDGVLTAGAAYATTTISANLNAQGALVVDQGILDLTGGGTLGGTITIDYGTTLQLDGDTYTLDSATFVNGGTLNIGSGAMLTGSGMVNGAVTDNGAVTASGGTLILSGGVSGAGTLIADAGAVLDLVGGGTLTEAISGAGTLQLDGGIYTLAGGELAVANVAVDTGSNLFGNGIVDGPVGDAGTVEASGGVLVLSGGVSGAGALIADSGAVLDLVGGGSLTEAISGGGTLQLDGGTYTLGGGELVVANAAVDSGAVLKGNGTISGAVVDAGSITASGGTLTFAGVVCGDGAMTATAGAALVLTQGAALTETISGAGTLQLTGTTTYSLAAPDNVTIAHLTLSAGATLSGAGTIASAITNAGTIVASGGTLVLQGAISGSGVLQVAAGSTLDLTHGGILSEAISGAGTLELSSAYTLGGHKPTTATVDIAAGASLTGAGRLIGAVQDAGILTAAGGTLVLAGALSGAGTLTADAGAVLDLTQGGTLNETISGAGELQLNGAQLYTLAETTTVSIADLTVGTGVTLSGAGTIASAVTDTGTLAAYGGRLLLLGDVEGAGHLEAAAGATLDLTAGGTLSPAISGAGTLELGGAYVLGSRLPTVSSILVDASASLSGSGNVRSAIDVLGTVQASTGTLSLAGTLSGNGTLLAAAGAVLAITKGGAFAGGLAGPGTVEIAAATTLDAGASLSAALIVETANVSLGVGESVSNAMGDSFAMTAASGATVAMAGATGDSFTNAGNFTANGAGSEHISAAFINTGSASVSAGTLTFMGTVTNNGSFSAAAGTAIFDKDVGGTGTMSIGATGTLSLLLGSAAGQTVDFLVGTGALDLTAPTDFLGTIAGFGGGDIIDLLKTKETSWGFNNGVLTIKDGSKIEASLNFLGAYNQNDFTAVTGSAGTTISFV
jgi:fibronectin-binding autotransporter adhesin